MPGDIEGVTRPLSISIGDADIAMGIEQVKKAKAILEKKMDDDHEVIIIPGAPHGFAVRGDPANDKAAQHAEQAKVQAVEWFKKWLH